MVFPRGEGQGGLPQAKEPVVQLIEFDAMDQQPAVSLELRAAPRADIVEALRHVGDAPL
jgi:hypothetical protein